MSRHTRNKSIPATNLSKPEAHEVAPDWKVDREQAKREGLTDEEIEELEAPICVRFVLPDRSKHERK